MAETFLTVEQAAGRLHIAPYTLREWIKRGKVRSFKPGRAWLIPEKALDELASASHADNSAAIRVVETIRARDARTDAQGKLKQNFDVAEELNTMRDERLRELSGDFMAKLDASAARIKAGTLRPITSDDISKAIADARP